MTGVGVQSVGLFHALVQFLNKGIHTMLILSRYRNQEIVIGDSIRIRVHGIQGKNVSLAIDAPPEVSIRRSEIVESPREKIVHGERDK